jgi:dienelactone hydrolase
MSTTVIDIDKDVRPVRLDLGPSHIDGFLGIPSRACGVVLFAHGSGSGRFSPRNQFVASELRQGGVATLLIDLLTAEEAVDDEVTARYRFDIDFLARRVQAAAGWLARHEGTRHLPVGYFGASTGAAAALVAAENESRIAAVVSRGGRPDLAGESLPKVTAPTLLIVGEMDTTVLRFNREALARLSAERKLVVVAGASHLFEEPGTLEEAAHLALQWFQCYLSAASAPKRSAA